MNSFDCEKTGWKSISEPLTFNMNIVIMLLSFPKGSIMLSGKAFKMPKLMNYSIILIDPP